MQPAAKRVWKVTGTRELGVSDMVLKLLAWGVAETWPRLSFHSPSSPKDGAKTSGTWGRGGRFLCEASQRKGPQLWVFMSKQEFAGKKGKDIPGQWHKGGGVTEGDSFQSCWEIQCRSQGNGREQRKRDRGHGCKLQRALQRVGKEHGRRSCAFVFDVSKEFIVIF